MSVMFFLLLLLLLYKFDNVVVHQMWDEVRRRLNHFLYYCLKTSEVLTLTSPSSSSTSRKSKSLKTLNCCSEVVSSMLSGSRVPSSEDTRLGWCSMRSSSPQLEKITYTEKQIDKSEKGLTGYFWMHDNKNMPECWHFLQKLYLTEGFFVSPTSCPHKDKTFTSFSRVLFCRGQEKICMSRFNFTWTTSRLHLVFTCDLYLDTLSG